MMIYHLYFLVDATFTGTYPARAIRWNASNGYFQRRNAANNAWERLEGADWNSQVCKFRDRKFNCHSWCNN